jgi:predicted ATP-dependent serine protease
MIMKTKEKVSAGIDPARVALLLGVTIGLGIVVHEGFLLVAGAIAVGAFSAAIANAIHDHTENTPLRQEHRH